MTTFAGMVSAKVAADFAGTKYLALVSAVGTFTVAGTELTNGNSPGYARTGFLWTVTPGANTSTARPSGIIVFPTPTGDWTGAVGVEVWDAASAGNREFHFPLPQTEIALTGFPIEIPPTLLSVILGGAQV